jgi:hypothetical protein
MPYKWIMLLAVLMAATPAYLLWQGNGFGAAVIGIPSFLVGAAMLGCIGFAAAK